MEPMSGLRLHEELVARGLRNPLLFLSGHGDIPMVVEALKKGAFDFLEKPYSDNTLVDRVEQALAVEAASYAQDALAVERQARLASLSEREREVMHRVAAGKLNKVIADGCTSPCGRSRCTAPACFPSSAFGLLPSWPAGWLPREPAQRERLPARGAEPDQGSAVLPDHAGCARLHFFRFLPMTPPSAA